MLLKKITSLETNTTSEYGIVSTYQTRNNGEIVFVEEVIDDTEALGAFDTLPLEAGSKNLDLGGGKFDTATEHVKKFYNVKSYVYDPYARTSSHNDEVLTMFSTKPADTVTSISVLNVISTKKERKKHIQMSYDYLKKDGRCFFKIWRGNNTNVPTIKKRSYQSNSSAEHYINEIKKIYGENNVHIEKDDIGNTIVATKRKNTV